MIKTKKKTEPIRVVMLPSRPSIASTLKLIPIGGSATFTFKALSPSVASVRSAATRLNASGRYGRYVVHAYVEQEMYFISRQ